MRTRSAAGNAGVVLVMVGAAALVGGCGSGTADESAMGLASATAARMDITSSVAATGTIEPIRVIDVKSQASGEVLDVAIELGDDVEQGDLLVRIDPRDVRNAYEQAVADLEVAQARFTVSQRQLSRTVALRDSQVVTEDEYEQALLENANAKAGLVKAETNLELAKDKLDDVTVRAPITGTVVEKAVEEGQIITSAKEVTGGTILLRMADLTEVQVRTLVDETDIGSIKPDLAATIRVEAYPDRQFQGRVLQVEPQAVVQQNVTLFAVLTRIRNEEGLLKPGMNADVEVVVGVREGVLALPNAAVKTTDEARQLVAALGLDAALLEQRVEPSPAPEVEATRAESADSGTNGAVAEEGGIPTPERVQAMSREERRALIENLPPAERQRLFQRLEELREQEARAERSDPGRPKPAFVFVSTPRGGMTLEPVLIGLSSWEHTEVVAGVQEGEQVLQVPLSLIQQQELLERIRSRTQIPGMNRG